MSNGTIEIRTHVHEQKGTSGDELGKVVGKKYSLSIKTRRFAYLTAWFSATDAEIAEIVKQEQAHIESAKAEVIF